MNHHGTTQAWTVTDGVITGSQDKPGDGGIILTDRKYRNFEISLDVNPDYGCDSGLFLRSNEKGQAYQVMLDYLDGGASAGFTARASRACARRSRTGRRLGSAASGITWLRALKAIRRTSRSG